MKCHNVVSPRSLTLWVKDKISQPPGSPPLPNYHPALLSLS